MEMSPRDYSDEAVRASGEMSLVLRIAYAQQLRKIQANLKKAGSYSFTILHLKQVAEAVKAGESVGVRIEWLAETMQVIVDPAFYEDGNSKPLTMAQILIDRALLLADVGLPDPPSSTFRRLMNWFQLA